MKYFGEGLSEKHKKLNAMIRKRDSFDNAKELFLEIHAKLHLSVISDSEQNEVDMLLADLQDNEYSIMPTSKDETIGWVLWHIARIEDLTMNYLVARKEQVFNDEWKKRMNAPILDTGNALTDDEIINLSKNIQIDELIKYRNEVGKTSRKIVAHMEQEEMKRKINSADIEKIKLCGGVTAQEESSWLLDFWGKKDVAGILLMPPTRHVMLHLNDCCKWKNHIRANKKIFRSV